MIAKIQSDKNSYLIAIFSFFCSVYCLQSFVNHYLYRTYALDLGMFNQALYAISHGHTPLFTLDTHGTETHFLATHFSPITYLYAPLYFLFKDYTLPVVQILFIMWGGLGVYRLAQMRLPNHAPHVWRIICVHFFCCWGIFSALSFDFHNNVPGAMVMPWFVYYFYQRNKIGMLCTAVLMACCQETMPLWLCFVILALMADQGKRADWRRYLRFEIPLLIGIALYAAVVIQVIMPALQSQQENLQLSRYTHLGSSVRAIISHVFTHPIDSIQLLFKNTTSDPTYDYIKAELHIMVAVSGGILLVARPFLLIMLVPIYAQKLLSNDYGFWGINGQYSIELVPIISIGIIAFIRQRPERYGTTLSTAVLIITVFATASTMDHRQSKWYNPANTRIYQAAHYRSGFKNFKETDSILNQLPEGIPLVTSSRLAPHLANQERMYHFPIIKKDAAFIVLDKSGADNYPLRQAEYLRQIELLRNATEWKIKVENGDVIIFEKRVRHSPSLA
jgi:uncharacterized membrane protein